MNFRLLGLKIAIPALLITATGVALAQFQKPEDAIKYRQSVMTVMANHFGRIGPVVKGEAPYNKDEVAKNAALVATLSTLTWQAYGPGTEGGKGQPEIWTDSAKFKTANEKFQSATAELNVAAQSGNLDNVKKAFGAVGQACKACHDDFRKK